jgi:fibronectin type 3 domain-containing protein
LQAQANDGSATLTWNAVAAATSYRVYRATSASGPFNLIASPASPSYPDTGLANGTTYYYVVRAHNGSAESGNSQQISATPTQVPTNPPPAGLMAPDGLQALVGDGSATLTWNVVGAATSYRVHRGASAGGPYSLIASPTSASYADTGLTNGTTYYYVVRSHSGAAESGNSQQISATPSAPPPPAPTGVTAVPDNGSVALSWNAVTGATAYRVYRAATSGGSYALINSPVNSSYMDTGLTNGTAYYYVVRAYDGAQESQNSSEAAATPMNVEAPPPITPPSDEFSSAELGAAWTPYDGYKNELPGDTANHAQFEMVDSHLSIDIPGGQEHNMWLLRHAAVLADFPGSGIYETKVDSALTGDQQFGLIFQQNSNTFLAFMLYVEMDGSVEGYVERFINVVDPNVPNHPGKVTFPHLGVGAPLGVSIPIAGPFYVRVEVTDHLQPANRSWKFSWSPNGADWYVLVDQDLEGPASDNIGEIESVGVFAGNQPNGFDAFDARFDYFRYYPDAASMPAAAPTNLVARGGDNKVELWWDAVPTANSYGVYAASNPNGPFTYLATTAQPTFSDFSVSNGASRSYIVRAARQGFEGPASVTASAEAHVLTEFSNVPTNGLLVALSASELATLQLTDGQPVKQWPNVIGPQIAATGELDSAPIFVASGIYGKPVVRFDGVDDFLQLPAGFADFTAGLSVYVVMRPTALLQQDGFKIVLLGNGQDEEVVALGRAGSTNGLQYATTNSADPVDYGFFNTPDGLVLNQPAVFSVRQDSQLADPQSLAVLAKDGTELSSGNVYVPPVEPRNLNYIGKSYWPGDGWLQGDIAEVLIYNRKVTQDEDVAINSYLMTKYGL